MEVQRCLTLIQLKVSGSQSGDELGLSVEEEHSWQRTEPVERHEGKLFLRIYKNLQVCSKFFNET